MDSREQARLALDRLPSRFPAREPADERARGPGAGSVAVGLLSVGLVVALAFFWQSAKPGPAAAQAGERAHARPAAINEDLAKAESYLADGQPDLALALLAPMADRGLADRDVLAAIGHAHLALEDRPSAYEAFTRALRAGPPTAPLHFAAGTLASKLGKAEAALNHLRAANNADPGNPDYALFLGQAELAAGEMRRARAALVRVTHQRPEDARAWGMLAEIALRENQPEMALQHAGRARHTDPDNDAWKIIQARALKRRGDAAKALTVIADLTEDARLTKPVLRLAGECHGMLRQPERAGALYRRASDARPSDGELAFEAALWLDRAGDRPTALAYAKRARQADHPGASALVEKLADQREFKAKPRMSPTPGDG